ncbi:TadE/TadG family type IV pilus assembly protein [Halomonas sp. 328]|uniref:TadE/TadG family type IV pilus assembly protein n=1 Tax=Halomonas sp. 328 TaxID=2776704 RepID=UPI0018A70993|nr:TadE family protein [Halomonas sp. 328]MBF8221322.1 pilus assembly protein [Halomonas sp. 328]
MKKITGRGKQDGAVAIEFVIVFPLFLMIFYAIVSYSIIFVGMQNLHSVSAEAARAVVSLERDEGGLPDIDDIEGVIEEVLLERGVGAGELADLCNGSPALIGRVLEVCLQIKIDDLSLPQLKLPGIPFSIPHLDTITSTSSIRL